MTTLRIIPSIIGIITAIILILTIFALVIAPLHPAADPPVNIFENYDSFMPGTLESTATYLLRCEHDNYNLTNPDNFHCRILYENHPYIYSIGISGKGGIVTYTSFRLRNVRVGDLINLFGRPIRERKLGRLAISLIWENLEVEIRRPLPIGHWSLTTEVTSVYFRATATPAPQTTVGANPP